MSTVRRSGTGWASREPRRRVACRRFVRTARACGRTRNGGLTSMHPKALVDLAAELLREVLKLDAPADKLVSSFFRRHRALGARERHALAETVYAVLRRRS